MSIACISKTAACDEPFAGEPLALCAERKTITSVRHAGTIDPNLVLKRGRKRKFGRNL